MKHSLFLLLVTSLAFGGPIPPPAGYKSWKAPVTAAGSLPVSGLTGDCRVAKNTGFVYCWNGSAWVTGTAGGSGTVTSAGVVTNATTDSIFVNSSHQITGSPVTSASNMTLALASQSANQCLCSPDGSSGAPVSRALVAADLPTVTVAKGGTNSTAALNNNRVMVSSSGSVVESAAVSASLAECSDSNGIPAACGSTTTTEIGFVHGVTSAIQTQLNAKLPTTGVGLVEVFTGMLEAPTDKTYTIDQKAAFAYTVNSIDVATVSGTTTLALKINGTSITGCSAVSVSSTPATGTCTAANAVSAGNKLTLVLSSSASPVDMSFTVKYTR